ncbi:porin family protein, partial [Planctomycetota bacterium]|nr:porin family protein [Planctomycetota bacterium]
PDEGGYDEEIVEEEFIAEEEFIDEEDLLDEPVRIRPLYPVEEREFGPVMVDYRGPVELNLYAGWTMYSGNLDIQKGGSAVVGGRFSFNFGPDDEYALDLNVASTVAHYRQRKSRGNVEEIFSGDVNINSITIGGTYRLRKLRFEYLTPYVSAGLGVTVFGASNGRGVRILRSPVQTPQASIQTPITKRLDLSVAPTLSLGFGFDYKIDKNWSIRVDVRDDILLYTDFRSGESFGNATTFTAGLIWHFEE